jgi:hypothetical protein
MSEIRYPWLNHYPSVEQESMSRDLPFWLRIGPIVWHGRYMIHSPEFVYITYPDGTNQVDLK